MRRHDGRVRFNDLLHIFYLLQARVFLCLVHDGDKRPRPGSGQNCEKFSKTILGTIYEK